MQELYLYSCCIRWRGRERERRDRREGEGYQGRYGSKSQGRKSGGSERSGRSEGRKSLQVWTFWDLRFQEGSHDSSEDGRPIQEEECCGGIGTIVVWLGYDPEVRRNPGLWEEIPSSLQGTKQANFNIFHCANVQIGGNYKNFHHAPWMLH